MKRDLPTPVRPNPTVWSYAVRFTKKVLCGQLELWSISSTVLPLCLFTKTKGLQLKSYLIFTAKLEVAYIRSLSTHEFFNTFCKQNRCRQSYQFYLIYFVACCVFTTDDTVSLFDTDIVLSHKPYQQHRDCFVKGEGSSSDSLLGQVHVSQSKLSVTQPRGRTPNACFSESCRG